MYKSIILFQSQLVWLTPIKSVTFLNFNIRLSVFCKIIYKYTKVLFFSKIN